MLLSLFQIFSTSATEKQRPKKRKRAIGDLPVASAAPKAHGGPTTFSRYWDVRGVAATPPYQASLSRPTFPQLFSGMGCGPHVSRTYGKDKE